MVGQNGALDAGGWTMQRGSAVSDPRGPTNGVRSHDGRQRGRNEGENSEEEGAGEGDGNAGVDSSEVDDWRSDEGTEAADGEGTTREEKRENGASSLYKEPLSSSVDAVEKLTSGDCTSEEAD